MLQRDGIELSLRHSWPFPLWLTWIGLIGLCLLVLWLYRAERSRVAPRGRFLLAFLRTSLLLLLTWMMFGWTLSHHRTDLPDIVVALDDSQSMDTEDAYASAALQRAITDRVGRSGLGKPSRWNQALSLLTDQGRGWLQQFAARYRVKLYRMAGSARLLNDMDGALFSETQPLLGPQQTTSRLGGCLRQILASQRGRPTAAVVLLTDGVTTEGPPLVDVAELARQQGVPLYVVGLGDDQPPADVRLADLQVEGTVFVDDIVEFRVQVQHDGYADRQVTVQLQDQEGEVVAQQSLVLAGPGRRQPVELTHRPQQEGLHEYRISVTGLPGEVDTANNQVSRNVMVRDTAIRVLLVQAHPSYEFRTLRDLLNRAVHRGRDTRYVELTTVLQEADIQHTQQDSTATAMFPVNRERLFGYDVLILGDADPRLFGESVLDNVAAFVTQRGGGLVLLAGPRFMPAAYRGTALDELIPVDLSSATVPDPDATLDEVIEITPTAIGLESPPLKLGRTPRESAQIWRSLPGAYWFLDAPDLKPAARVLATRNTPEGGDPPEPALCMQFVGSGKCVLHMTDETYRWAKHSAGNRYYARYWLQLLRYLSRSKLASQELAVAVSSDRDRYSPGESVRLRVKFQDDRRAPAGDMAVRVAIESHEGARREVQLRRERAERGEFTAFLNDVVSGDYRMWLIAPSLDARPPVWRFSVDPPGSEQARLALDVGELQQAARTSNGRFYRFQQADRLPSDLPRGRHVRVESAPPEPIWNSAFAAILFAALLASEWMLRRRWGLV